ncbi:Germin-like protein subfamily 3 member 3, partial [Mucuna pruriens]
MKNMSVIVLFLAIHSWTCHASTVNDFCVADLKSPDSPSGYECLPTDNLTADNFVFSLQPENTSNPIKAGISSAFVNNFPALNGLGISAVRVVMEIGGYFPMHTHPDATELIIMVEGEITAGFVTPSKAYVKTLNAGDLMVIPPGHLHFVLNSGKVKATLRSLRLVSVAPTRIHALLISNMVMSVFFLVVLSSTTHASKVNDFCVADLKGPDSPSGYQCLPPNRMTADNFVFSFKPENTSNPMKAGVSTAFVKDFPGLNDLGISAVRVSMDRGGFFPMHTHDATELIITVQGEITAGFVTATKAYVKTLKPGDLMVIPQGLLHFVVNSGRGKAFGFAAFSSSNPGVHSFNQIFANNVPSPILAQTTFLDVAQVKKLKALFGGTN